MPTWELAEPFRRDWHGLHAHDKERFRAAVTRFVADLREGQGFRPGLRVKGVRGATGVFEMTWAPDGRATFSYGEGGASEAHVVWRRIGSHDILRTP